MVADDREGVIQFALKLLLSPVWVPAYVVVAGVRKLGEALEKRKIAEEEPPKHDLWASLTSEDQRAVVAALIKIGRPAKNVELAQAMGCSPGEATKRRKSLNGALVTERIGRDLWISIQP